MEQAAKLEYVSLQNLSRETWHFATHHARVEERDAELGLESPADSARRRARSGSVSTSPVGATSRVTGVLRRLDAAPRLRHLPGAHRAEHDERLRVQGRATGQGADGVARDDPRVEEHAQKTNAYQENRNLLLSKDAHADSIPGLEILANDVRCTHGATLGRIDRDELFYAMARGLSRPGRADHRPRLLPGRARPHRARAGEALGNALDARIRTHNARDTRAGGGPRRSAEDGHRVAALGGVATKDPGGPELSYVVIRIRLWLPGSTPNRISPSFTSRSAPMIAQFETSRVSSTLVDQSPGGPHPRATIAPP